MDGKLPHERSRLRRLPEEHYCGPTYVHWTLTLKDRKQGWLTDSWHKKLKHASNPKSIKKLKSFDKFATRPVQNTNVLIQVKTVLALKNPMSLPSHNDIIIFIESPIAKKIKAHSITLWCHTSFRFENFILSKLFIP